jgi:hypothetical protein
MDMMDLPPRLELASATCISATFGYEPPGSRRGDGGELQEVLALYLARTITRRSHLNARCPTHTLNSDLLAGAYLSQIDSKESFPAHSWSSLEVVASSTFEASTQSLLSSSLLQLLPLTLKLALLQYQ